MKIVNLRKILKVSLMFLTVVGACVASVAFADNSGTGAMAPGGIGTVAHTITSNMTQVQYFILGSCYLLGLGFSASSIFKFKSHKDNPTQIPIGTPIALGFIGAAFLFIPSMFNMAGITLFGTSYQTAGPTGDNAKWYDTSQ